MTLIRKASRSLSPLTDLEDMEIRPAKRVKQDAEVDESHTVEVKAPKKRRKTKAVQEVGPLQERVSSLWKVGPHVSCAGGVENSIINAALVGANAFALFVKSQRKWDSPPLSEESIRLFKERLKEYSYLTRHILPHGNYLVNLGNPDTGSDKRNKSYACFVEELKRCEQLGLELFNFHPGSSVGETTVEHSISLISQAINEAHRETTSITVLLESMAGSGNVIGSKLEHLASIIEQVKDKQRVGVCVDTCHSYSAGYDIKNEEGWNTFCQDFDRVVGLRYFRAMHLNDSKTEFASKKDRHENIGLGTLGLAAFHHILRDPRTQDMPLILETPTNEMPNVWAKEIEVLNALSSTPLDDQSELRRTELLEIVKTGAESAGVGPAKKTGAQRTKSTKKRKKKGEDVEAAEESE